MLDLPRFFTAHAVFSVATRKRRDMGVTDLEALHMTAMLAILHTREEHPPDRRSGLDLELCVHVLNDPRFPGAKTELQMCKHNYRTVMIHCLHTRRFRWAR